MKTIILAFALAAAAAAPAAVAQHAGHGDGHMTPAKAGIAGTGTVDAVKPDMRQVKLTHAPIKAIGWPAMTMDFAVAEKVDLSKLKAGDKVEFELVRGGDGIYMIASLTRN